MINSRKKILIFSTAYLPLVGGAEIAVKEITDRLVDYDFDLITARLDRKLPKQETIGRVTVHRIGFGCGWDKFILMFTGHWLASKLHQDKNYGAIWAIMASYAGLSAVRFKKKYHHIPFLLTLQEGDSLRAIERKVFLIKFWWLSILKSANCIQAISSYLAEWPKALNVKTRVEVIPNGVDLKIFKPKFEFNNVNNHKIVTTSRLVDKNGLDLVIKALPYLGLETTFHIAGIGPEENNIRDLAAKLKVSDRVIFHGLISYEKLPAFLLSGDVFVRPSRTEGLGNSFLEAMACGIPVVGTLVGGIGDFLVDRQTGIVVNTEDPIDIVRAVTYVFDYNNIDSIKSITKQAIKMIDGKYSWDIVSQKMRAVFNIMTS